MRSLIPVMRCIQSMGAGSSKPSEANSEEAAANRAELEAKAADESKFGEKLKLGEVSRSFSNAPAELCKTLSTDCLWTG